MWINIALIVFLSLLANTSSAEQLGLMSFTATIGTGSEDGTNDNVRVQLSGGENGQMCTTGVLTEGILYNSWSSGDTEAYLSKTQDFGSCANFEANKSNVSFTIVKDGEDGLDLTKMKFHIGSEIYVWEGEAGWDPTGPSQTAVCTTGNCHLGCFVYQKTYSGKAIDPDNQGITATAEDCQKKCQSFDQCVRFNWRKATGCYLKSTEGAQTDRSTQTSDTFVTGPKYCPENVTPPPLVCPNTGCPIANIRVMQENGTDRKHCYFNGCALATGTTGQVESGSTCVPMSRDLVQYKYCCDDPDVEETQDLPTCTHGGNGQSGGNGQNVTNGENEETYH